MVERGRAYKVGAIICRKYCSTCLGMNTEWTLKQVIETLGDVDVKTRETVLEHYLILCFRLLRHKLKAT